MDYGREKLIRYAVELGVIPGRRSWSRGLLGVVRPLLVLGFGFVAGPLVLALDLGRIGRRVGKLWVVSYLCAAIVLTVSSWGANRLLMVQKEVALEVVADFSGMQGGLDDGVPFPDLINLYALRYDLDPALVAAVIKKESGFDPNAVSPAGARGLMQLRPATWRELAPDASCDGEHAPPAHGPDCIFSPEANIRTGALYLRRLLDEFQGDVVLTFAAYNAGAGAVSRFRRSSMAGLPPYRETRLFVRDVLRYWPSLRGSAVPPGLDVPQTIALQQMGRLLPWVSLGYWLLFFLWACAKIPWREGL